MVCFVRPVAGNMIYDSNIAEWVIIFRIYVQFSVTCSDIPYHFQHRECFGTKWNYFGSRGHGIGTKGVRKKSISRKEVLNRLGIIQTKFSKNMSFQLQVLKKLGRFCDPPGSSVMRNGALKELRPALTAQTWVESGGPIKLHRIQIWQTFRAEMSLSRIIIKFKKYGRSWQSKWIFDFVFHLHEIYRRYGDDLRGWTLNLC